MSWQICLVFTLGWPHKWCSTLAQVQATTDGDIRRDPHF
jgi:hypothetical protein